MQSRGRKEEIGAGGEERSGKGRARNSRARRESGRGEESGRKKGGEEGKRVEVDDISLIQTGEYMEGNAGMRNRFGTR